MKRLYIFCFYSLYFALAWLIYILAKPLNLGFETWMMVAAAFGAVYLGGWRWLPVVFFGDVILVEMFGPHASHIPFVHSLSTTGGIIASVWFIRTGSEFDPRLGRVKDAIKLILAGGLISPVVVTIGMVIEHWLWTRSISSLPAGVDLINCYANNALGILVFAPMLLVGFDQLAHKLTWRRWLEIFSLLGLLLVACYQLFFFSLSWESSLPFSLPLFYPLFPLIIWGAVRFGSHGSAFIMPVITLAALLSFTHAGVTMENVRLAGLIHDFDLFMACGVATNLILGSASVASQNNRLLFQSMFELSGVPMAQCDVNGRFKNVNARFVELTGYSRNDILGKTFNDITHPEDRVAGGLQFKDMVAGNIENLRLEKRYIRPDGKAIWVDVSAVSIKAIDQRDSYSVAVIRDISSEKLAKANATASEALAVEANRAKSVFLAGISHEIRTPLGVILGFVELLREDRILPEQRRQYLETIYRNATELGRLIDDILDLSKVEAGRLDVVLEPVALPKMIADLRETFCQSVERKGLTMDFKLDADVPETIVTDPVRLRQIMVNLVGNAIKFSTSGGVNVHISRLSGPEHDAKLSIAIQDTGAGITDEERNRIFVPFGQGSDKTTKHFGGTGLGLVLSKRLAGLLGGDVILAESKVGVGSKFVASIRLERPTAAEAFGSHLIAARDSLDEGQARERPLDGIRILVAEDTPDQALLIQLLLTDQGARVESVANGSQAIDKVKTTDFDAVLMDMQMPVMDGFTAARHLRENGFRKPIIALTAQAMKDDQVRSINAGCTAHVAKPFTQEILTKAVLSCYTSRSTMG